MGTRIPGVHGHRLLDVCKGPWSVWGSRGYAPHGCLGPACCMPYTRRCPLVPVQRCPLSSRPQPLGSGGDTSPYKDTREDFGLSFSCHHVCVAGWLVSAAFNVSLGEFQWSLGGERPTRVGLTVAPLPAAYAWTRARTRGSLTGVRTALLPLIHATWAPTQGTALLQVSPTALFFYLVLHGKVPETVALRRDFLYFLAEVSSLTLPSAFWSAVGWSIIYGFFRACGPRELRLRVKLLKDFTTARPSTEMVHRISLLPRLKTIFSYQRSLHGKSWLEFVPFISMYARAQPM